MSTSEGPTKQDKIGEARNNIDITMVEYGLSLVAKGPLPSNLIGDLDAKADALLNKMFPGETNFSPELKGLILYSLIPKKQKGCDNLIPVRMLAEDPEDHTDPNEVKFGFAEIYGKSISIHTIETYMSYAKRLEVKSFETTDLGTIYTKRHLGRNLAALVGLTGASTAGLLFYLEASGSLEYHGDPTKAGLAYLVVLLIMTTVFSTPNGVSFIVADFIEKKRLANVDAHSLPNKVIRRLLEQKEPGNSLD